MQLNIGIVPSCNHTHGGLHALILLIMQNTLDRFLWLIECDLWGADITFRDQNSRGHNGNRRVGRHRDVMRHVIIDLELSGGDARRVDNRVVLHKLNTVACLSVKLLILDNQLLGITGLMHIDGHCCTQPENLHKPSPLAEDQVLKCLTLIYTLSEYTWNCKDGDSLEPRKTVWVSQATVLPTGVVYLTNTWLLFPRGMFKIM